MKKKKEEIIIKPKNKIEVPEYCILGNGKTIEDIAKKYGLEESKLKELNGEVFGTNQIRLK